MPTPPQPLAAAIAVNPQINTAPAVAGTSAATAAIGEPIKGQGKSILAAAAGQAGSSTQGTADNTAAPQPSATPTGDSTGAGSPGGSTDPQVSKDASAPQAQPQSVNDPSAPAQTNGAATADLDRTASRPADLSGASSSGSATEAANAPSSAGAAKTDAAGIPNFGFAVSAATAPSSAATTATSGAAATAAVPISGLAVAIASRAQAGSTQFDIRLDPPELGRIDVRLDVDHDGQVTTHVTAERADTLQLLQNQQPQLERALEQAGLKTADNGLQFTLRDQSFTGQNDGGSGSQPGNATQLVIPDPDLAPVAATQIYTRAGLGSGVDIRV